MVPHGELSDRDPTRYRPARRTIHAVILESEGAFVAECIEVGVVTEAESLDELLRNLRDAVGLFLENEDPATLGLARNPRLAISFETAIH